MTYASYERNQSSMPDMRVTTTMHYDSLASYVAQEATIHSLLAHDAAFRPPLSATLRKLKQVMIYLSAHLSCDAVDTEISPSFLRWSCNEIWT